MGHACRLLYQQKTSANNTSAATLDTSLNMYKNTVKITGQKSAQDKALWGRVAGHRAAVRVYTILNAHLLLLVDFTLPNKIHTYISVEMTTHEEATPPHTFQSIDTTENASS